jgi:hypothetical protein
MWIKPTLRLVVGGERIELSCSHAGWRNIKCCGQIVWLAEANPLHLFKVGYSELLRGTKIAGF